MSMRCWLVLFAMLGCVGCYVRARHTYIPKSWNASTGWTYGQEIVLAGEEGSQEALEAEISVHIGIRAGNIVADEWIAQGGLQGWLSANAAASGGEAELALGSESGGSANVSGGAEIGNEIDLSVEQQANATVAAPVWVDEVRGIGFDDNVTGAGTSLSALGGVGVTVHDRPIALTSLVPLRAEASASIVWQTEIPGAHVVAEVLTPPIMESGQVVREYLLRVTPETPRSRPPVRVVLVLDHSTSMELSWQHVVAAVGELLASLRADDEVSIVTYAQDAELVAQHASSAHRASVVARLRGLRFAAGSNLEAGLRLGLAQASDAKPTVVWLVTDGVPQGGASLPDELAAVVQSMPVGAPCQVNVIAYGTSIQAETSRAIADAGNGTVVRAPGSQELASALSGVANDLARIALWNLDLTLTGAPNTTLEVLGAGQGYASASDGTPRLLAPVLLAGQEATLRVRIRHPRAVRVAAPVAQVVTQYKTALGAQQQTSMWTMSSDNLQPNWRLALDLHLKEKLQEAALAVERGDVERITTTLGTHTAYARQLTTGLALSPAAAVDLRMRVRSVGDFVDALVGGLAGASRSERRSLAGRMRAWVEVRF